MVSYGKVYSTRVTPQSEPIPGSAQVKNSAGGYVFAVDDWARLDRWLVLGSEGSTYYVSAKKLTVDNAEAVRRCIGVDGKRVVARIVEVSEAGRAPKNDPALFALAMCAGLGDVETRRAALEALPRVARTGRMLFLFCDYVQGFRGWGRLLRNAVGAWYNDKAPDKLAYQVLKYRQRDGWTHRDCLRLAKPVPVDDLHNAIFNWVAKGWPDIGDEPHPDVVLRQIWAFERAQRAETETEICGLISQYNLPWEAVPTNWLGSARVWERLLPHLPMTALIRNLGRMTANGLLKPMSEAVTDVVGAMEVDRLRKARVHPVAVLAAMLTYQQGHGERGKLTWQPVREIVDALDRAFYLSYGNVTPTGKRIMLALDVSGSMGYGEIAGVPGLTPRVGAAAMALVTANVEPSYLITGFTAGGHGPWGGGRSAITELAISSRQRLDDVVRYTESLGYGGTDCALPMLYALRKGLEIDAFVVITDNESWFGTIHPAQALRQYREKTSIPVKLIAVAMTATEFSVADPNDAGSLDCIGFDTATPQVISQFIAGDKRVSMDGAED
jgi:60 kDa SS-A/Ro ribonucleoprotein